MKTKETTYRPIDSRGMTRVGPELEYSQRWTWNMYV